MSTGMRTILPATGEPATLIGAEERGNFLLATG